MAGFRFELDDTEKTYLRNLVRESVLSQLEGRDWTPPDPPSERLREHFGAFVTLKIGGRLRGCIGHIMGNRPLFETVAGMARSAAFEDPRFPPLSMEEFQGLEVEISVMSPLEECPDPSRIEVGRHGLIMVQGQRSGLLLPQVPLEWGWDRETFLAQTCAKAGLGMNCWKEPGTTIYWFEAEVF